MIPVVKVCAWCPAHSYRMLRKGEVYSHGICNFHRQQVLQSAERTSRQASAIFHAKDKL